MLHGRGTGGLQVLPPGTTEWQFIKPLKGHAVCNVGDTLGEFFCRRFPHSAPSADLSRLQPSTQEVSCTLSTRFTS